MPMVNEWRWLLDPKPGLGKGCEGVKGASKYVGVGV